MQAHPLPNLIRGEPADLLGFVGLGRSSTDRTAPSGAYGAAKISAPSCGEQEQGQVLA